MTPLYEFSYSPLGHMHYYLWIHRLAQQSLHVLETPGMQSHPNSIKKDNPVDTNYTDDAQIDAKLGLKLFDINICWQCNHAIIGT